MHQVAKWVLIAAVILFFGGGAMLQTSRDSALLAMLIGLIVAAIGGLLYLF